VIKGVPLVHRGEVWLVSSQLKGRLLRERASYKSAIAAPTPHPLPLHLVSLEHPLASHLLHNSRDASPLIHSLFIALHPPSLPLFPDACAAISWPVPLIPPPRAPGATPRAAQALPT
jgi:hypothetical protein